MIVILLDGRRSDPNYKSSHFQGSLWIGRGIVMRLSRNRTIRCAKDDVAVHFSKLFLLIGYFLNNIIIMLISYSFTFFIIMAMMRCVVEQEERYQYRVHFNSKNRAI